MNFVDVYVSLIGFMFVNIVMDWLYTEYKEISVYNMKFVILQNYVLKLFHSLKIKKTYGFQVKNK